MKRIIVSVTNDLTTDQRVHKVCTSLSEKGYTILLIGRKLKTSIPLKRNYQTSRMRLIFNKGFLFYAEYNFRLFWKLLFLKKDILVSNDLDTLAANYLVHKISKKKIVYDSHELFTQVPELINRPFVQNFWKKIEQSILPNLKNTITVCDSIAKYYNNNYKTSFQVIKNVPRKHTITKKDFPFDREDKRIILYQGAVNVGRGLELMIESMQFLEGFIFVIAGTGDIFSDLQKKTLELNLIDKVKFLGRLDPEELRKLTPSADLGVSLEEDLGLNYRYALPNKIFDYMHAKVPILISDLPEMEQIVTKYNIGKVVANRCPNIAQIIIDIFDSPETYNTWCSNLNETIEIYNWEQESKKLKAIYRNLL